MKTFIGYIFTKPDMAATMVVEIFFVANVILNDQRGPDAGLFTAARGIPVHEPHVTTSRKILHESISLCASMVVSANARSSSAIS